MASAGELLEEWSLNQCSLQDEKQILSNERLSGDSNPSPWFLFWVFWGFFLQITDTMLYPLSYFAPQRPKPSANHITVEEVGLLDNTVQQSIA